MATNYWLFKSEEDVYSIDDLKKEKTTHWEGVRNYQARNFIRDDMKKGDLVLYYHSNCENVGVYGIAEIIKEAYPDFTAFDKKSKYYDSKSKENDPTWFMVDIRFKEKFDNPVYLTDIKSNSKLKNMRLVQRGNRLSVFPVTKTEFDEIVKMSKI